MTLMEAIAQLKLVKQAITDGKPVTAAKLTLPVQEFVYDTALGFGLSSAPDAAEVATFRKELEECAVLAGGITTASGPEAAKFGDGALLKLLLELLLKFGPIFLTAPKPPGQ